MRHAPESEWTLQARYPLPDWVVDSKFKQGLTLTVAHAIGEEVERRKGPTAQRDFADRVTRAVREALKPSLTWMADSPSDGVGHPGDVLVSYISQLALTRPGEDPDPDRYRELLRAYGRYLVRQARHFDEPTTSAY
jgi:hypothetical protein